VQTEQYLLACCRYIELNPVRARIVANPGEYHWSSYTARMGGPGCEWLDLDPMYLALGDDETARQRRYLTFLEEAIPTGEWELIREAVKRGQLTGTNRFAQAVEQIIGRRIERRGPGRPLKTEPEAE
jgi:putative transposase